MSRQRQKQQRVATRRTRLTSSGGSSSGGAASEPLPTIAVLGNVQLESDDNSGVVQGDTNTNSNGGITASEFLNYRCGEDAVRLCEWGLSVCVREVEASI